MPNDLVVRFRGDEGNRQEFFSGLAKGPEQLIRSVQSANAELLRQRYNISKVPNQKGAFLDVQPVRTYVDAINGVVKQVGQLGIQFNETAKKGGGFLRNFLPLTEVEEIQGNTNKIIAASKEYVAALTEMEAAEESIATNRANIANRQQELLKANPRYSNAVSNLSDLRAQRDAIEAEQLRVGTILGNDARGAVRQNAEAKLLELEQQHLQVETQINNAVKERDAARKAETRLLERDVELTTLKAQQEELALRAATAQAGVRGTAAKQQAALTQPVETLPANYQILPNQLRQILERGGLQPRAGQSLPDYLQRQTFNAPRYDLVRDVTRYSGSFENSKGIIADWAAEVDRGGKVVTRFGGQLSGASQVLKQITRDFQKVIEFTIATTVVFGALRYATEQLNTIKEIDYSLQKFAITAQKSPQQAQQSFGDLARIAHNTATPLLEMINAADDIALATKRSGQSTDDWNRQILSLTESVGVFTNLTGVDTVQATDTLTATMKQLQLTASDIPAILSKITAVAGGQSQAIADITKGLSVMAQAGKVANLTIDEQIATVQVLSQVTSKTPAEVATAFKNLVGSLGSPAALKGLAEFNIAVRDQEGNLRNILDVYGDIASKIKSGIIPTGDVQGLIRAISGGPRRAPDAAALLAAIDQITEAQKISEQATNEAAIANAKAIDTTKAKFIQLQNAVDAVTFEKFGEEFKTFIGTITNFITTLLNLFNSIPTGIITATFQIGLFFLAVRLGTRVMAGLGGFLVDNIKNFTALATSIDLATAAQLANNAASAKGGLVGPDGLPISSGAASGSRLARYGALAGKLGAGALVGGTVSALTGGSPLQILGGGLQGLGIAGLSALPGLSKLIGVAALGVGTFLQFTTGVKDNTEAQQENAIAALNSYSAYKESLASIDSLNEKQKTLSDTIDDLTKQRNKDAEDQARLSSSRQEYAKNTLDLINATIQLNQARKELLANQDPEAAAALKEIQQYKATGEALDDLILKYQKIVLSRAGLSIPTVAIPGFQTNGTPIPQTGSTIATKAYTPQIVPGQEFPSIPLSDSDKTLNIDLKNLATDADRVKNLFNDTGTELTASFSVTRENIDLVTTAINKLAESNPTLAAAMLQTANAFFAQSDSITELNSNLAAYQAYIDALSYVNPTLSGQFQKLQDFATLVKNSVESGVSSRTVSSTRRDESVDIDVQREAAETVRTALQSGVIDYEQLKKASIDFYNSLDPKVKAHTDLTEFLRQMWSSLPEVLTHFGDAGVEAYNEVSDAAKDAASSLESSSSSLEQGIIERITKVQADLQAGIIKPGVAEKSMGDLRKYLSEVQQISASFGESFAIDPGFLETLQAVQPEFSNIIGLENAASLTGDEFINTLLNLGDTYGLNGKQLQDLGKKVIQFHDLLTELNAIRIRIPVALDVDTIKRQIVTLVAAIVGTNPLFAATNPLLRQLFDLKRALDLMGDLSSLSTQIGGLYGKGGGTSIGSYPSKTSSTAKTGLDVSELDIPEEILQSPQMQELIRQAIANATKLQSQIPGATKDAKNDLVVLLDGLTKVMQVHGVKSEYLSKALDALAEVERKRLEFDTKADTIRRIRVGAGDFSAIANVPVNSTSGVSLGGAEGPINITLNLNGTVLTPAQLAQFADLVAGALKRQIAGG